MKTTMRVLILALLTGCASSIPYQHNSGLNTDEAFAAIDRALTSQPRQFAAEYVEVTDEYVGYSNGVVTTGRSRGVAIPIGNGVAIAGGNSRSSSKALTNRIYFDTFQEAALYSRKSLFVVKVISNDGQPPKHFYLYNQEQGKKLVDALYSLQKRWSEAQGKRSAS